MNTTGERLLQAALSGSAYESDRIEVLAIASPALAILTCPVSSLKQILEALPQADQHVWIAAALAPAFEQGYCQQLVQHITLLPYESDSAFLIEAFILLAPYVGTISQKCFHEAYLRAQQLCEPKRTRTLAWVVRRDEQELLSAAQRKAVITAAQSLYDPYARGMALLELWPVLGQAEVRRARLTIQDAIPTIEVTKERFILTMRLAIVSSHSSQFSCITDALHIAQSTDQPNLQRWMLKQLIQLLKRNKSQRATRLLERCFVQWDVLAITQRFAQNEDGE